jgi:hypothetical protein
MEKCVFLLFLNKILTINEIRYLFSLMFLSKFSQTDLDKSRQTGTKKGGDSWNHPPQYIKTQTALNHQNSTHGRWRLFTQRFRLNITIETHPINQDGVRQWVNKSAQFGADFLQLAFRHHTFKNAFVAPRAVLFHEARHFVAPFIERYIVTNNRKFFSDHVSLFSIISPR